MPSRFYKRSNLIPGSFPKGNSPHNKGKQLERVKKKIQLFNLKQEIECKKHGLHLEWRLHTHNNVKCKKCSAEIQKNARELYPIKYLLNDAKAHANSKGIIFNLNEQDIIDLLSYQDNKCALSGLSFQEYKFSLDKINPKLGYTKDNIQLLTIVVNKMKIDFEQSQFLAMCEHIANNFKKKK